MSQSAAGGNPPVYNCHVYVAPADAQGVVHARAAQLADLAASGKSQREALAALVATFKRLMTECHQRGETPAWLPEPLPKEPGESDIFIAVHL